MHVKKAFKTVNLCIPSYHEVALTAFDYDLCADNVHVDQRGWVL